MATQGGSVTARYEDAYRFDLFISYAHGPQIVGGDGPLKRWSRQFRDLLELNLNVIGDTPVRIFFDNGPRVDESLDPLAALDTQFPQELAQSAMLQVHMSKHYLRSDWCGRELSGWQTALPGKIGGPDRRISLVRLGETGDVTWPEALAPNGIQLPGTRFHDAGSAVPWGFNLDFDGNAPSEEFSAALLTTAAVINKRLEEIRTEYRRRAAEAQQVRALDAGPSGVRSIYLHGRRRESDLWSRTFDELSRFDVEVRPSNPAPDDDEGDIWNSLSKVASQCEAMLLVGGDPFELDADLDVVGRDRRNYIQSKFRKFLPCAVVDRSGLKNARMLQAAKLRGIDWLDAGTADWGGAFRTWLGDAARRTAGKYGLDPQPTPDPAG